MIKPDCVFRSGDLLRLTSGLPFSPSGTNLHIYEGEIVMILERLDDNRDRQRYKLLYNEQVVIVSEMACCDFFILLSSEE